MQGQHLKGHLDLLLLAVIASGQTHGYAIAQALRSASDGDVDLKDGTIYPALRRLERHGLISSRWSPDEGRRRRSYALTAAGRRRLEQEKAEWARFERSMSGVLGLLRA